MKTVRKIWVLLTFVLVLTSCSFVEFIKPPESTLEQNSESRNHILYAPSKSDSGGESLYNNTNSSYDKIDLSIIEGDSLDDVEDSIPAGAIVNLGKFERLDASQALDVTDNDLNKESTEMEIKLFFADRSSVLEGQPGSFGFVSPVIRNVSATSGILKLTLDKLIEGPLLSEEGLDPVIPATVRVNNVTIEDRIAVIDFNKALITDHAGGTLGGSITMQAIVFTASQFESVEGVLVTVEGKPWDDGHFIWDSAIFKEDLLNSFKKSQE